MDNQITIGGIPLEINLAACPDGIVRVFDLVTKIATEFTSVEAAKLYFENNLKERAKYH